MSYVNHVKTAWTPDIIGPIYKKQCTSLREVLNTYRNNNYIQMMAAFVPDELVHLGDLSTRKSCSFVAVMATVSTAQLFDMHKKYVSAENGGSHALFCLLNSYIKIIIEEVYFTHGDVLKFSQDDLLVMWKVNRHEFVSKMVHHVILCAQRIQAAITQVKSKAPASKVDVIISAGEVTFSIIGDDRARHFLIAGSPIEDLKFARRICLPGDLVLSSSAWEHCTPSQYEYVIKDSNNIKIIKVLGPMESSRSIGTTESMTSHQHLRASDVSIASDISIDTEIHHVPFHMRASIVDALRPNMSTYLKSYISKGVLMAIENEESLLYLTELRQITAVCIAVVPNECTVHELISLTGELYNIIQNTIETYFGCPGKAYLYSKNISFQIIYGMKGYESDDEHDSPKNGLLSASQIMKKIKRIPNVKTIFIGVATGIAFCGVVGHSVRRQYMVFGTPVDKATSLMMLSFDKISCDYETLLSSTLPKERFRTLGMRTLRKIGKCHVYEFLDEEWKLRLLSNLEYVYPILGRYKEMEYFKDILDDIGVAGRVYAGLLMEGPERCGKSRILDAFVTIVRSRQIKLVQLSLHPSYAEKTYATLYEVFLQLFEAENFSNIKNREKIISYKLSEILKPEDFCYLNTIMRVQFPLSKKYCEDDDWQRCKKTIAMFDVILTEVIGCVCILLDDIQYMDPLSWQFLSYTLNNSRVVLVMTVTRDVPWDDLPRVENSIFRDKRLMIKTLDDLDPKYLAAFACQFLNVVAIPLVLVSFFFCFENLSLSLQTVTISPAEAAQYDLVFPDQSLLSKIPAYLMPEEIAPPLGWTQMSKLTVCVRSKNAKGYIELNRDTIGLRIDIYNRMNPYDQAFIKCAATIGYSFQCKMLDTIMTNATPMYTLKGNRGRDDQTKDLGVRYDSEEILFPERFVLFRNEKAENVQQHASFDVLVKKVLPSYAYCKVLTFTITSFRKLLYEILTPYEKNDYHVKTVRIYEKDATKCNTCGEEEFLKTVSIETDITNRRAKELQKREVKFEPRRSIFITNNEDEKNRDSITRRVSILPGFANEVAGKYVYITKKLHDLYASTIRLTERPRSNCSDQEMKTTLPDNAISTRVEQTDDPETDYVSDFEKREERSLTLVDLIFEDPWDNRLEQFSYVDYRNCRCIDMISYVFWKLYQHIVHIDDPEKLVKFTLNYSAGAIQTGQPLFAIKSLEAMIEDTDIGKIEQFEIINEPANKIKYLILMGDAYSAYGNYSQAKKFYTEAVLSRGRLPQSSKAICCSIVLEQIRYNVSYFRKHSNREEPKEKLVERVELAIALQRLAVVSMAQNETKMAKLAILQSLRIIFESPDCFPEKGEIYLSAVETFRLMGEIYMEKLETPILSTIKEKTTWKRPEEMILLAQIYQTMYETRILQGKLMEGIEIGINICKICNYLQLNNLKLAVLPSLIEIMVWTKKINETVDLLRELYYLSKTDVDYTAITWYYALCMELLLDTAMILETYEACHDFYARTYKSRIHALRDPESVVRLKNSLVIWQLRMNVKVTDKLVRDIDDYLVDVTYDNFARIYNCVKILECYLLIIHRGINIRRTNDMFNRSRNIKTIIKSLHNASSYAPFIKPFLYLLQSYMEIVHGRKILSRMNLKKSRKFATAQGNKLVLALLEQNKRTWEESKYNNMAEYWVENVGVALGIEWQEIHSLSVSSWSTILYPLPPPHSNF
ncbi:Adenylate cyclase type 10 [Melipona quadrifasciata]|uniref:Adenylate cyclase type 10 n=1 Tax=Melipona quadrifasciata TaxID=166423 RepID=A0A0N0U6H1_9HYME|nr:Adenylate cyclase type 10 [Melipona quadrifasciata]